jgi:acyl carrier protein
LCREQYLAGELKIVHSWTNPAPRIAPTKKPAAPGHIDVQVHDSGVSWSQNGSPDGSPSTATASFEPPASSIQHPASSLDRTAERIETWLLEWLVARLGLDTADVSRDQPFAEFGVDSLTAVELSQELEDEFKIPLPPIVAWNYPTPAALARYLAEQTFASTETKSMPTTNGQGASQLTAVDRGHEHASPANRSIAAVENNELARLLAEIENLTDEEADRLLAEEQTK